MQRRSDYYPIFGQHQHTPVYPLPRRYTVMRSKYMYNVSPAFHTPQVRAHSSLRHTSTYYKVHVRAFTSTRAKPRGIYKIAFRLTFVCDLPCHLEGEAKGFRYFVDEALPQGAQVQWLLLRCHLRNTTGSVTPPQHVTTIMQNESDNYLN